MDLFRVWRADFFFVLGMSFFCFSSSWIWCWKATSYPVRLSSSAFSVMTTRLSGYDGSRTEARLWFGSVLICRPAELLLPGWRSVFAVRAVVASER